MMKVVLAVPVRNEYEIEEFIKGIEEVLQQSGNKLVRIILAVNNSEQKFIDLIDKLAKHKKEVKAIQLGSLGDKTFAYAYLSALKEASVEDADVVVEVDAGGSFSSKDIPRLISLIDGKDAVFSNRFTHSGRLHNIYGHSLSRKALSAFGTVSANLLLRLGRYVPDMTSGLSAVRKDTLIELFENSPRLENWVSVSTVGHFFQTEYRTRLLWLSPKIAILNISMGNGKVRKSQKFKPEMITKSLKALYLLATTKKNTN